jgi:hypothetical protein
LSTIPLPLHLVIATSKVIFLLLALNARLFIILSVQLTA